MNTTPFSLETLRGVFAVPPLPRQHASGSPIDFTESRRLVNYIADGGITRLLYGGNAFLYHMTLDEYAELIGWLAELPDRLLTIPSVGPSFGRAIDQIPLLTHYRFPAVMMLPCGDPRDAKGLEDGLREFVDRSAIPLILYMKDEGAFGPDLEAGLDAVGRLVADEYCVGIKYAVVRPRPAEDRYLDGLLKRVDRARVISGIGERPAIVHVREWGLPGFTTGSGCIAPALTQRLFELCADRRWDEAEAVRQLFLPLEDLRDELGPARVLHAATDAANICRTGPIRPYISELPSDQRDRLAPIARALRDACAEVRGLDDSGIRGFEEKAEGVG
jgi:dihydrodipicolinate synthase/N-acetylneuraminate lyase